MKKIGIVGGIAWPSTVEYYAGICREAERRHLSGDPPGLPSIPEMAIESLDLPKAISYLGIDGNEDSWSRFDKYHRAALQRLEASGAEVAVMASNSAHHRFAAITRGIGIPVINLIDVAAAAGARIGARQVLVLGTELTMGSAIFRAAFADHGIEATGPRERKARNVVIDLIAELQLGKHDGFAERIGSIARRSSKQEFTAPLVVCLACTELPLAFPEAGILAVFEFDGITYINTPAAHIRATFDYAASMLS